MTADLASATIDLFEGLVLVVDDDPTQRKLAAIRLRSAGFAVETVARASDAVAKALACEPDVILSDVLMGDLDGFTLCTMMRAEPKLTQVPIILLSANLDAAADAFLAERVGATAIVLRTPLFETEMQVVRRAIAHSARREETDEPSLERRAPSSVEPLSLAPAENGDRELERLEALEDLAKTVAHDVNNVLSAILTTAHFLVEALPEGEQSHTDAREIQALRREGRSLLAQLAAAARR